LVDALLAVEDMVAEGIARLDLLEAAGVAGDEEHAADGAEARPAGSLTDRTS